jgi:hypothetical protein
MSNRGAVNFWILGENYHGGGHLWTDGRKLYSYAMCIGDRNIFDEPIVLRGQAPWAYPSPTTKKHMWLALYSGKARTVYGVFDNKADGYHQELSFPKTAGEEIPLRVTFKAWKTKGGAERELDRLRLLDERFFLEKERYFLSQEMRVWGLNETLWTIYKWYTVDIRDVPHKGA